MRLFGFVVSTVLIMSMIPSSSLAANVTSDNGDSSPYGHILKFVDAFQAEISIISEKYGGNVLVNGNGNNTLYTNSSYSSILGGAANMLNEALSSTIAGGAYSYISGCNYSAVAGGYNNDMATANYSFIGGGRDNSMTGGYNSYCVTAGGYNNDMSAGAECATISGGKDNDAEDNYTTVCGGRNNRAIGEYSTVGGGYYNWAAGDYAFVAGKYASTYADGTFVFGDSSGSSCISSTTDQFKVCVDGGAYFDLDGAQLYVDGTVRADDFIEYSPYPKNADEAYASVMSVQRLPDGQYDPEDIRSQMDHSNLHSFVRRDSPEGPGCSLSALVSSQNEVIKDLVDRIYQLESQVVRLEEALTER
jgi:hypothetical protein